MKEKYDRKSKKMLKAPKTSQRNTALLLEKTTYQKHLHAVKSPGQSSAARMPTALFSEKKLPTYKNSKITKYIVQKTLMTRKIEEDQVEAEKTIPHFSTTQKNGGQCQFHYHKQRPP